MDLYFGIGLMILLFLATIYFYEKKVDELEEKCHSLRAALRSSQGNVEHYRNLVTGNPPEEEW